MSKLCDICGTEFTKRRPNSCQRCYFKKRHLERYQNKLRKCVSCDKEFYLRHNKYCEMCKDNILKCESHQRIYFGRKFSKSVTGYWVCSKKSLPWAHRWVWMNEKGEIPKGYDIHHIDGDKDNNSIENLEKITRSDHQQRHWEQGDHDHEMELRIRTLAAYRKKRN